MRLIRHAFRLATIALAVVAVAAIPGSALAAGRVETGTFPIEEHYVDSGASDACGFSVSFDQTGSGRYEVRFDGNGNPANVATHISRTGTVTGNRVSLSDFDRENIFVDLRSGAQMEVGIVFRVSHPGGAPAIFDRGRLVFDANGDVAFVAAPHPALDGDFSGLCAALGG